MTVNCECCHFHAVMRGLSLNSFFQLIHGKKVYVPFNNLFSFVLSVSKGGMEDVTCVRFFGCEHKFSECNLSHPSPTS